jgi:hypothetical protein
MIDFRDIAENLLKSDLPEIRWKSLVNIYNEEPNSKKLRDLSETIRTSPVSQTLLQHQNEDGMILSPEGVYQKWQGTHWVLASLADIVCPASHSSLLGTRDQMLDHWLS